jgi:hypothetical protein
MHDHLRSLPPVVRLGVLLCMSCLACSSANAPLGFDAGGGSADAVPQASDSGLDGGATDGSPSDAAVLKDGGVQISAACSAPTVSATTWIEGGSSRSTSIRLVADGAGAAALVYALDQAGTTGTVAFVLQRLASDASFASNPIILGTADDNFAEASVAELQGGFVVCWHISLSGAPLRCSAVAPGSATAIAGERPGNVATMVAVASLGAEANVVFNTGDDHFQSWLLGPNARSLGTAGEVGKAGAVFNSIFMTAIADGYAGVVTDASSEVLFFNLDRTAQLRGSLATLGGVSASAGPARIARNASANLIVFPSVGSVQAVTVGDDGTTGAVTRLGDVPGTGNPKVDVAQARGSAAVAWAAFADPAGVVRYRAIDNTGAPMGDAVPLPSITAGPLLDTEVAIVAVAGGFIVAALTSHGAGSGSAIQLMHLVCPN